jgi:hypothetical protein
MGTRTTLRLALAVCFLVTCAVAPASGQPTLLSQTIWGTPDHESTQGLAVGPDGSTYLAGNHIVGFDPTLIFVVKFAPDGSIAWQRTWDGSAQFSANNAQDVAVAPDGSAVYVTGTSFISPNVALLLKFDAATGALVWNKSWGGNAFPEGVTVDVNGFVHVAGSVTIGTNQQIFTTKFGSDGSVVWHKVWNTPETNAESRGQDVTSDASGNIYIAGVTPIDDPDAVLRPFGIVVLKIDVAGNLMLQRTVLAGESVDARGGIAIGPDGSVHVAGAHFDEKTSDLNAFVVKLDLDGNHLWNRNWGGRSGDDAHGIAVRGDGNIFVTGISNSFGAGSDDVMLLRFNPDGKITASQTWGGPEIDHGDAIGLYANGDVAIGATAELAPYIFAKASSHASKARAVVGTPDFGLLDVASGVVDAGGATAAIAGTTNDDLGFDAALLIVRP